MTLAQFVVTLAVALTTIAVALIVGAVILMEKEEKRGGVLHAPSDTEFHAADKGPEIVIPLNRFQMITWTPVEERLPEEDKRVLVTAEWYGEIKQVTETTRLPGEGKTRVWTIGYGGIVLAWAELPEPYKK